MVCNHIVNLHKNQIKFKLVQLLEPCTVYEKDQISGELLFKKGASF